MTGAIRLVPVPEERMLFDTPPRTPDGVRIYAVGDVHGRLDLLLGLQQRMEEDQRQHPGRTHLEIYLGDYVDRGPASAGVLEALSARRARRGSVCLSGNHEDMMLDALDAFAAFPHWLQVGGREAVRSYLPQDDILSGPFDPRGVWEAWRTAMPSAHVAFLRSLALHHVCGDYLFVHAGLRPGVPLYAQTRSDRLWIRHDFLDYRGRFERMVVHGHTPQPWPEVRANRIGIDTGAFATGQLTCLVLDGADRFVLAT